MFEAGRVIQVFKTVVPDGASAFGAGRMVRASRHLWNIYVCGRPSDSQLFIDKVILRLL
jgi:hypothetical protein